MNPAGRVRCNMSTLIKSRVSSRQLMARERGAETAFLNQVDTNSNKVLHLRVERWSTAYFMASVVIASQFQIFSFGP